MNITALISFVVWNLLVSISMSDSIGTLEERMLHGVSVAIGDYKRIHGRLPRTWEEISTRFDAAEVDSMLKEAYGYRLRDRYEFVLQDLPMYRNGGSAYDIEEGSKVILARVTPFRDYRANGSIYRSFIYQTKGGDIFTADVTEDRARTLAKKYNVTLPVREGVPAIETNESLAKVRVRQTPADPSDAKRVLPSGRADGNPPARSPDTSNNQPGPAVAIATDVQPVLPGPTYLWAGIATLVFIVACWFYFCSKRSER